MLEGVVMSEGVAMSEGVVMSERIQHVRGCVRTEHVRECVGTQSCQRDTAMPEGVVDRSYTHE